MELVNRYISAVQRYLPEEKRSEIGRELTAHLLDKMENQQDVLGRNLTDDEVAAILQQWGHPRQVAIQYVPPTPLVSSELMPMYKKTLIYIFGLVFALHCLGSSVQLLKLEDFNIVQVVFQSIFGFFDSAATTFFVVTMVFYAYSVSGAEQSWLLSNRWRVQDLPPVSRPWQQMNFTDLFTDLVTTVFLLLLLWPSWWMSTETLASNRVMLAPELQPWVPWVTAFLLLAVLINLWWLLRPYWTRLTLSINVVLNVVFSGCFVALWFVPTVLVGTDNPLPRLLTIEDVNRVVRGFVLFAGIVCLYEIGRDLYRLWQISLKTAE